MPVESPIQALLRAGRASRDGSDRDQLVRYRRLGLAIILATALSTATFLIWLVRHIAL